MFIGRLSCLWWPQDKCGITFADRPSYRKLRVAILPTFTALLRDSSLLRLTLLPCYVSIASTQMIVQIPNNYYTASVLQTEEIEDEPQLRNSRSSDYFFIQTKHLALISCNSNVQMTLCLINWVSDWRSVLHLLNFKTVHVIFKKTEV